MEKLVSKVKDKYSWISQDEATALVDNAVGWFYALRYPCEPYANPNTHPIETFMDEWAVQRICDEIAQRNGFNTALGYRENGIQFTFDGAWISDSLRKSIVPIIGVI